MVVHPTAATNRLYTLLKINNNDVLYFILQIRVFVYKFCNDIMITI